MAENNGELITGIVIGGLIGFALGILFAPKSGRETREEIVKKAKEGYEKAAQKATEVAAPESFRDFRQGEELV